MEKTLDAALSRIFGEIRTSKGIRPVKAEELPAVKSDRSLSALANEHYERAMKAQKEGNWALYGEEIEKLGEIIRQMQRR